MSQQFTRKDSDPIYLVRSAGRMAQMLLEIRDEYVTDPRDDTLDQFERRLAELADMLDQLRELRAENEALDLESHDREY